MVDHKKHHHTELFLQYLLLAYFLVGPIGRMVLVPASLHRLIPTTVPNSTKLAVAGHGAIAQDILSQITMLWPRDPLAFVRLPIGVLQQLVKTP